MHAFWLGIAIVWIPSMICTAYLVYAYWNDPDGTG